jgi:hypothetical protein
MSNFYHIDNKEARPCARCKHKNMTTGVSPTAVCCIFRDNIHFEPISCHVARGDKNLCGSDGNYFEEANQDD